MTPEERKLCLSMTREGYQQDLNDPNFERIRNCQCAMQPLQLPEPWNGHLSSAKIMYIGSNPSYSCNERFPTQAWTDDAICDFFDNRFLQTDIRVSFWTRLVKMTRWILAEIDPGKVIPEYCRKGDFEDYRAINQYIVSTEIVHWKSTHEQGVRECIKPSLKWMEPILKLFTGKVVVLLGGVACEQRAVIDRLLQRRGIKVLELPHPGRHGLTDAELHAEILRKMK